MGLDSLTLRVPTELRATAEKAAQDAGHTLATELRNALATHYKMNTAPITLQDLEARISQHEILFHAAPAEQKSSSLHSSVVEPAETNDDVSEPQTAALEKERADRELTLNALEMLASMLKKGDQPTPTDLSERLGIRSRGLGRLLSAVGISATNTRINNKASRYFLKTMLPDIEKAHKKLLENPI